MKLLIMIMFIFNNKYNAFFIINSAFSYYLLLLWLAKVKNFNV